MKDIIGELSNPSNEYRGHPFWSWNDKLDPKTLRWQVNEMKRVGLGGYFMHARGGLITEYLSDDWFDCINACVDEGKKSAWRAGAMTKTAGRAASEAVSSRAWATAISFTG